MDSCSYILDTGELTVDAPVYLELLLFNNIVYLYGDIVCMYICMVITYSRGKDQPGKVANPARGQLNRKNVSRLKI